ncbi:acyl transferase/acyl hydrolase/lysophospholipase [Tricladium varicosporioides]|nr:acyl transferase/acyl hydrolase/lysophospholipase [Hymenoscyphus varicosporioides]
MAQFVQITQVAGNPLDENGLCLLSLDGGGVRGLSTLLILKTIMDRVNRERNKKNKDSIKPSQMFDLIGGTSTGGLIAIMLGRLEMDVDQCIIEYKNMFKRAFTKKKMLPISLLNHGIQARFDSAELAQSIEEVLKRNGGLHPNERFYNKELRDCRTFVCATARETAGPNRLRDYELPDRSNNDTATIVQAALATSAAPSFFDPVTIDGRTYVDGGLGANNPVKHVWNEAQNIWCDHNGQVEERVKCFISIGTGHPGRTPVHNLVWRFLNVTLRNIALETTNTATEFAETNKGLLGNKRYFRYNVPNGLDDVGLEEYEKEDQISTVTVGYLNEEETIIKVTETISNLAVKECTSMTDFA